MGDELDVRSRFFGNPQLLGAFQRSQGTGPAVPPKPAVTEEPSTGWISGPSTVRGTAEQGKTIITATGIGSPPTNARNATIGRELAKDAAYIGALAKLLEAVKMQIVADSRSEGHVMTSSRVETKASGYIQGAHMVGDYEILSDGAVKVTMQVDLSGITLLDADAAR